MRKRELGEILDECLEAYQQGRRSIEDCLSLYPAIADELEPLLRTAVQFIDTLEEERPPAYLTEQGRMRFLAAASTRARARAITRSLEPQRAPAWSHLRWGAVGGAMAAGVALLVTAGAMFTAGGGGSQPPEVVVNIPTETAAGTAPRAMVSELLAWIDHLPERVFQDQAVRHEAQEWRNFVAQLPVEVTTDDVTKIEVGERLPVLKWVTSSATPPDEPEPADETDDLKALADELAEKFALEVPDPTPEPTPTPSPEPSPEATPEPEETPEPTPTPAESPPPSPGASPPTQAPGSSGGNEGSG
jgi:hypothetical protein